MARRSFLLLALAVLSLAGCSSAPTPTAATSEPGPDGPSTAPVDLHDEADMTQGVTKDYSWDAGPNATAFTVELIVGGLNGAPVYEAVNFGYDLSGGKNGFSYASRPASGSVAGGSGPDNALEFDGLEQDNPAQLVGSWNLRVTSSPSEAHYAVTATVHYARH